MALVEQGGLGSCSLIWKMSVRNYWTRPELAEVEYNGSKKNNILANGPRGHITLDLDTERFVNRPCYSLPSLCGL